MRDEDHRIWRKNATFNKEKEDVIVSEVRKRKQMFGEEGKRDEAPNKSSEFPTPSNITLIFGK